MKKTLKSLVLLSLIFSIAPLAAAPRKSSSLTRLSADEIKNCPACIPSIGQSKDGLVDFKNGEFHSADYPFAEMRAMAFGMLNGKAAAVAEMCWNTGGSGNWETVLLFVRKDGKVFCKGAYTPGRDLPDGGTMVGRIEIKNNKIYMYGEDPVHNRKISKALIREEKDFSPCDYGK